MKRAIKASKFETNVYLVNAYGEPVIKLESDGGYYRIPQKEAATFLLDIGDTYHVEEIENEVD